MPSRYASAEEVFARSRAWRIRRRVTTCAARATRGCGKRRCNGRARPTSRRSQSASLPQRRRQSDAHGALPTDSRPRIVFPDAERQGASSFARPHVAPAEMPDARVSDRAEHGPPAASMAHDDQDRQGRDAEQAQPGTRSSRLHPEDAATLGIEDKDAVEIRSRRGRAVLPAVVTERVRAGQLLRADALERRLRRRPVHQRRDERRHRSDLAAARIQVLRRRAQPASNATTAPAIDAGDSRHSRAIRCRRSSDQRPAHQELEMSRIDALATPVAVAARYRRRSSATPSACIIAGFISGLRSDEGRGVGGVPVLPASAPFDADDAALARRFACRSLQQGGALPLPRSTRRTPATTARASCANRAREAQSHAAVGLANGQHRIADRAICDASDGVRLRNPHVVHGGLQGVGACESAIRAADDEHVRRRRSARQRRSVLERT